MLSFSWGIFFWKWQCNKHFLWNCRGDGTLWIITAMLGWGVAKDNYPTFHVIRSEVLHVHEDFGTRGKKDKPIVQAGFAVKFFLFCTYWNTSVVVISGSCGDIRLEKIQAIFWICCPSYVLFCFVFLCLLYLITERNVYHVI